MLGSLAVADASDGKELLKALDTIAEEFPEVSPGEDYRGAAMYRFMLELRRRLRHCDIDVGRERVPDERREGAPWTGATGEVKWTAASGEAVVWAR